MLANEIIKNYRQKKNISQEELAKRTDTKRSYIAKIESGKCKKVNHTIIKKICRQLEIPYDIEYELYKKFNYTLDELEKLDIFEVVESVSRAGTDKIDICQTNGFIDIIKILNNFKENKLDLKETISLLELAIGTDIRPFIIPNLRKIYDLDNLTIEYKKNSN